MPEPVASPSHPDATAMPLRLSPLPLALALSLVAAAAMPSASRAAAPAPAPASAPHARLATLPIPGHPAFVAIARDLLLAQAAYTPEFASQSGLVDDARRVPSYSPAHVAALTRRVRADLAALRALPWRTWPVDEQIDVRWMAANAQRIDRELNVEKQYLHRPGAWLEGMANNFISISTYAPARTDALADLVAGVPVMVVEMRTLCTPTQADANVARGLVDGIVSMLQARPVAGTDRAVAALRAYRLQLDVPAAAAPFAVVGAENYAWRLKHVSLLPWDAPALLALAEQKLAMVDAKRAALAPKLAPSAPLPPELERAAITLDQAALLAMYDAIQVANRAAIEKAGFVTIPPGVGPVRARVTPDAMVPMTGDGGSMSPPPPWLPDDTGWWNVEHFDPKKPLAEREQDVREGLQFRDNDMGPYAVHEGLPGHHLQLAIARLNPDPLRNLFWSDVQNEGWALYAEQEMWEQGGLGASAEAEDAMLESWRFRIRRVVYDVKIETGTWTLQQGADWKEGQPAGQAKIGTDVMRAVNWPGQLICYFAGKEQILALKADYRKKLGAQYTERRFHDELLALGSVPFVFARAKMLGEPVPDF
jgi:hypothetical protein